MVKKHPDPSKTQQSKKKSGGNIETHPSTADLILRKFGAWAPDKPFTASPAGATPGNYTAPPIAGDADEAEARRIKALLLKRFDGTGKKSQEMDTRQFPPERPGVDKQQVDRETADRTVPMGKNSSHPVSGAMMFAGVCFALLLAILAAASFLNQRKYLLRTGDGSVEIWQGDFAPMGSTLILSLPGMQPVETLKDVYTKQEVFPLICSYYIDRADAMIAAPGTPDFEDIQSVLNKALRFAATDDLRKAAMDRLRHIDVSTLLYKADASAAKGTLAGLEAALSYLNQAASLELEKDQAKLVQQKAASIRSLQKSLEAKRQAQEQKQ